MRPVKKQSVKKQSVKEKSVKVSAMNPVPGQVAMPVVRVGPADRAHQPGRPFQVRRKRWKDCRGSMRLRPDRLCSLEREIRWGL